MTSPDATRPDAADTPSAPPIVRSLQPGEHGPALTVVPAATVVTLRDTDAGLETLMLRKSSKLAFVSGMWVWPGGRLDDGDWAGGPPGGGAADPAATEAAARQAAVREAREEAAIELDPASLVWFSHWTTPPGASRRYATWFFAGVAPAGEVTVDGSEIVDHCWVSPAEALARREALEIEMAPPTWVTLDLLQRYRTTDEALAGLGAGEPEHFVAHFTSVDGGAVALYHGDAGYESLDAEAPGPRHRLWILPSGWRYERTP